MQLSRTLWRGLDGRVLHGSIETAARGDMIWLEVENPDHYETTTMDVLLTADEARELAAELTRLASLLDSNPPCT